MSDQYNYFRSPEALRVGILLWQIFPPILIVFGTIGNVLSIIILSKNKFKNSTSTVFLLGLAAVDLSMLYVGLLRQWLKYTFDFDIRHVSALFCKVHWWLMYVMSDCTVWILNAITIERLIATMCPHKSKRICSKKFAICSVVAILATSLLINCNLLYGFGNVEISDGNRTTILLCVPINDKYANFFGTVWTWIDLCKFSLIPFGIMATGNICIGFKLFLSKKKVYPTAVAGDRMVRKGIASNMTILLVLLNFVFIFCTLPVCVYFIGEPYWIPKDLPREIQLQDPWWALVNIMLYANSTTNFILYCLTGSRFRDEVRRVFRRRAQAVTSTASRDM
ncbi:hypothetical protein DPMN_036559 [Dreissena polymorpha]|uniref:G-protein coupled receptors family 1 profile domain-containing protein n=1 Tax=Dreissena polymorpha TaxID=45954 RepID=A0A9D4MDS7_DREPO|nr:hypothetical protein DPMN_036559 [Dreissena polymorpha]